MIRDTADFIVTVFVSLFTTSDFIILLWAVLTGYVYYRTKIRSNSIASDLRMPGERRANKKKEIKKAESAEDIKEHEDRVYLSLEKLNKSYARFANFTSVFPLWGMLGTVKALIGLASGMNDTSNNIEVEQFFSALTSTASGIIFAIIFKVLDSGIAPKIAAENKEYDLLVERNTKAKEANK